jgi:hypothetical protein
MRKRICTLALAAVLSVAVHASPCDSAQHGRFDFWLGDWDVSNAAGVLTGKSHVERILDGCVVMENWTSVKGGYAGKSFNTFDPATGQWSQHWVDNGGMSAIMTGEFHEKNLVYRRELRTKDGTAAIARMTFFDLGPGKVHQLVEQSKDGGKTWTTQIDLTYVKRPSP